MIEAWINVLAGIEVAFLSQLIVFPMLGIAVRLDQNVMITIFFTMVSLIRSYLLRRLFNRLHK